MQETSPEAERAERARALALVREAHRFLLVGHVLPDGDCLGAQAALASALESLGKEVRIVNPDPVQPQLEYLARQRRFGVWRPGSALPAHEVAVLLDFCELERCGPLFAPLTAQASKKLVIDHHIFHGNAWWDAAYLDPGAAATGLLVARMTRELGGRLDEGGAAGVFTSIAADTGWFKYSNTDAEALAVAAEMVTLGVVPAAIYAALHQRSSLERPRAVARALAHLAYEAGGRLAVVGLPAAAPGEPDLDDGDEVLDLLRAVAVVEVVVLLRETRGGEVRLSARSKGAFDANALARAFGGGGHRKAAGATLAGPLQAARGRVVAQALERMGASGVGRA